MNTRGLLKILGVVLAIGLVGFLVLIIWIAGEADELVRDKYAWRARGQDFGSTHTMVSSFERALADAASCASEKRENICMNRAKWFVWGALRTGGVQAVRERLRACQQLTQSRLESEQRASLCRGARPPTSAASESLARCERMAAWVVVYCRTTHSLAPVDAGRALAPLAPDLLDQRLAPPEEQP